MEPSPSNAESLGRQQAAPVRATDRFLVTPDELGDFERRQQAIGQPVGRGRPRLLELTLVPSMLLIYVRVLCMPSSETCCAACAALETEVKTGAGRCRRE